MRNDRSHVQRPSATLLKVPIRLFSLRDRSISVICDESLASFVW
jgi:hypothetical protein